MALWDSGPPRGGRAVVVVTDCQLVLLHRRQAEHIRVFSSIRFIKGFDVNGEFLHKGASEPVYGRKAHVRTSGLQGWLWDGWVRACWTPLGTRGRKGWSGGRDSPVLATSGTLPLSRELPRPGCGEGGMCLGGRGRHYRKLPETLWPSSTCVRHGRDTGTHRHATRIQTSTL